MYWIAKAKFKAMKKFALHMDIDYRKTKFENHYIFQVPWDRELQFRNMSFKDVEYLEQQYLRKPLFRRKHDKVFKQLHIEDPGFGFQWHLYNEDNRNHDINVTGVWEQNILGQGIQVCIIDDGIDISVFDLKQKFDSAGSFDFNTNKKLPLPQYPEDVHGTRCAGEVAAQRNDHCGVGVALESTISGIRILSNDLTAQSEASAFVYALHRNDIYSCSFGPEDNGKTIQEPPKMVQEAFKIGTREGRKGRGAIYVFASGNGGNNKDDCNADGYANSRYTFTIGAIDRNGNRPFYAENCASQLAVTYSGGSNGQGIYTTDVRNMCTQGHSGTSAAAPIASGIFALVLSRCPHLTWRTLMHLVVEEAVHFKGLDWQETKKNRFFSHYFGFGKIDAFKLMEAAKNRTNVGKLVEYKFEDHSLIGFQDFLELKIPITAPEIKCSEYVLLTLTLRNFTRGNIKLELVSPMNITSLLLRKRPNDESRIDLEDWTMSTVANWGTNVEGMWKLRISCPDEMGYLHGYKLLVTGESNEEDVLVSNLKPVFFEVFLGICFGIFLFSIRRRIQMFFSYKKVPEI